MIKSGKLKEAEIEILKAISNESDYADAHYNLGIIFAQRGEQQKANSQFHLAKGLDFSALKP